MLPFLTIVVLFAAPAEEAVKILQRERIEKIQGSRIDFKYPKIARARNFNAAVSEILAPVLQSFKENLRVSSGWATPGYLNGHYTANRVQSGPAAGILSILFDWDEYVPGAAHPYGGMASINYDPHTRLVLNLSDVFRLGVDYLSRLSHLAIDSLNRREYAEPDSIRRGAGPVEANFKVFTVTDTALVLHFPTYQVAAGAAGPQTVSIPLDALAPILRKR